MFFKRIISWVIFRIFNSPEKAAKFLGVKMGKGCKILDNPWKVFGSEPYLVELGDYVEITNGVRFCTHDGSAWCIRNTNKECENLEVFGRIIIKNNVFIGINSVILLNTLIEDNVVVGALSLVKGRLASNHVYCGNPAKSIKSIEDYKNNILDTGVLTHQMSTTQKKKWLEGNLDNEHF